MALVSQVLPGFMLIFCRITAFFVVSPVFSFQNVPNRFKIGLAFFVSLAIYSAIGSQEELILGASYVILILKETLIGLLLGFVAYLFFTVVQVAGTFADNQIGLGMANVIDPMTGRQSPVLGNFKFFLAMLIFLGLNGHHYLLLAIMNSYDWVPLDHAIFSRLADGSISTFLIDSFVKMFYMAFQMAAPLVVAVFLCDVGIGVLARSVPSFNVFVVGLPVKILVGFAVLLVFIPVLLSLFRALFEVLFQVMEQLIHLISV